MITFTNVTIQDILNNFNETGERVLLNDGKISGFVEDETFLPELDVAIAQ